PRRRRAATLLARSHRPRAAPRGALVHRAPPSRGVLSEFPAAVDGPVARGARAAAQRLAPGPGSSLTADVEAALHNRNSAHPEQYLDPISLGTSRTSFRRPGPGAHQLNYLKILALTDVRWRQRFLCVR